MMGHKVLHPSIEPDQNMSDFKLGHRNKVLHPSIEPDQDMSLSRDDKIATQFKVTSPAKAGGSDNQDNNAAVIKSEHDGHERDDITSPRSDFVKTESNEVESSKSPLSDSRDANTKTSVQLPKWNSIKSKQNSEM